MWPFFTTAFWFWIFNDLCFYGCVTHAWCVNWCVWVSMNECVWECVLVGECVWESLHGWVCISVCVCVCDCGCGGVTVDGVCLLCVCVCMGGWVGVTVHVGECVWVWVTFWLSVQVDNCGIWMCVCGCVGVFAIYCFLLQEIMKT